MARITTYDPLPITFTHGSGIWLYDQNNNAYLDSVSGIGVCNLGHAHPKITKVIQSQAAKLLHVSNAVAIQEQYLLAEKLCNLTNMDQVFFANSGSEANESAIKLTRLYGHSQGIDTPSIIVMERAFHGRTMATLTASGSRKVQAGFEPLVPGFIRAPFNDIYALYNIAHNRDDVVAIMLEVIQGEGGVHVADNAYLSAVAKLCHERDWLLIIDEVQTGNARTGSLYAYMQYGIQPDILTTAKGLGNGMPIGACVMGKKACNLFKPGNHGSTFGGNPLACITALTVLDIIEQENLADNAAKNGILLKKQLHTTIGQYPQVTAIRGNGLILGIELNQPAGKIRSIGLSHGILLNVTAENVIRLLPPLIINEDEIHELVTRLHDSLLELLI